MSSDTATRPLRRQESCAYEFDSSMVLLRNQKQAIECGLVECSYDRFRHHGKVDTPIGEVADKDMCIDLQSKK
jgi:hypothetical protein